MVYERPQQIPLLLKSVIAEPSRFEQMAARGAEAARSNHSPERTAKIFWDRVLGR